MYQEAGDNAAAAAVLNDMRSEGLLTTDRDYRALFSLYANMEGHDADVNATINEGLQKGILETNAQTSTLLGQTYYFFDQNTAAINTYNKAPAVATEGTHTTKLAPIHTMDR